MELDCIIREASPADLGRLHALASEAMPFDRFSHELFQQKLFFNPHPNRDEYGTLIAEEGGKTLGFLQHVIRRDVSKAWLGLFATAIAQRRRGIMKRLYTFAFKAWRDASVKQVDVLTIPTNYLVPGIDPRYTPAICFVEKMGFVQRAAKANMRAILDGNYDTSSQEARLAAAGIEVRRAEAADAGRIERFFGMYFGDGWLAEVRLSMKCDPPAVHLALKQDEIIAFSAHSSMNREWGNFGPMGTADETRGQGLGAVLLYRCMADLQAAGHATSVIPWIGPYGFYARYLNCAIDRVFWQHRLELP